MMSLRLRKLHIYGSTDVDVIDLDHHIVYIHGEIAVGKTTVLNLVDFAFGAKWKPTLAVQETVHSVRLDIGVNDYEVVVERRIHEARARVAWRNKSESNSAIVPYSADLSPRVIIEPDVFTFSDLIMHLWGSGPVRVHQSLNDPDSKMIRLSLRDFFAYCYLRQSDMDSSFFRMEDPFRRRKSQDVMRLVAGFNTERLAKLDERITDLRERRAGGLAALSQVRELLAKGDLLGTREEIEARLDRARSELLISRTRLDDLDRGYRAATNEADTLRKALRALERDVDAMERSVAELRQRIGESEALRSEYIALLFQTDQSLAAREILGDASYEYCPACAAALSTPESRQSKITCYVCKQEIGDRMSPEMVLATREDLSSRVEDVGRSIDAQRVALQRASRALESLDAQKSEQDAELTKALALYDDNFLAAYRDAERRAARAQEQVKRYEETQRLFARLDEMNSSLQDLSKEIHVVRAEIANEESALSEAGDVLDQVATTFGAILRMVGVPDFDDRDYVQLEARTWYPKIRRKDGDPGVYWDFESASSGGTMVLFKVCYALAVHTVASRRNLSLPTLLMIDTPTKNIAEDVNPETIRRLFNTIYQLAATDLAETQIVIADSEVHRPRELLDFEEIAFTRARPLISGFKS